MSVITDRTVQTIKLKVDTQRYKGYELIITYCEQYDLSQGFIETTIKLLEDELKRFTSIANNGYSRIEIERYLKELKSVGNMC